MELSLAILLDLRGIGDAVICVIGAFLMPRSSM